MLEYKFVQVRDDDLELEDLNKAAECGWEFTGLCEDTGFGRSFLMEREKEEPVESREMSKAEVVIWIGTFVLVCIWFISIIMGWNPTMPQ